MAAITAKLRFKGPSRSKSTPIRSDHSRQANARIVFGHASTRAILRSLLGSDNPFKSGIRARKKRGLFVSGGFVGWLCQYKTRKGNNTGPRSWRLSTPDNLTKPRGHKNEHDDSVDLPSRLRDRTRRQRSHASSNPGNLNAAIDLLLPLSFLPDQTGSDQRAARSPFRLFDVSAHARTDNYHRRSVQQRCVQSG